MHKLLGATTLAILLVVTGRQWAVAETGKPCVWPELDAALAACPDIAIVRVTDTRRGYRPGVPSWFRYKVVAPISGEVPTGRAELKTFVADGDECAPTMIDLEVGDRLVLGFGGPEGPIPGPVSAAAFLDRSPGASPPHLATPGLRRTTVKHVRQVVEARDAVTEVAEQLRAVLAWFYALFAAA